MEQDTLNSTISLMDRKTKLITDLFERVEKETEKLEDSTVSRSEKYELVMGIEYILLRIRILISSEQAIVKKILSTSDIPTRLEVLFKKRDVYLVSIQTRLNELREDISIIQKVNYTRNFNN